MTKERKEQLSNRLVLNFGILLVAAVVLLYVNTALRNPGSKNLTYLIIMIAGIVSAAAAIFLFVWGKLKKNAAKNYSAIGVGVWAGCVMLYASKLVSWFPGYTSVKAVVAVYIAMAVYFIVLAIITGVMLSKPLEKDPRKKIVHAKKRR